MVEVLLTHEQHDILREIVEAELARARDECHLFDIGSPYWNKLVARAQALRGLLSEIETATGA